ncbi:Drug Metabolite Transporter (DMT) Superfamily [Micractinium conductrix]|uniref:Drug Metabolite Transporter (DMT) Superfamily n=1 Tax=Micractinium conductrix TaxID=554055 RepID=A0A2P6VB43_9CHLO|nr:Drug Metabolite Transporter (DMT) Superfamily [Micractinium conductrix]|eukprot:PSC71303.1 Drug Metabolite Transporter (DMT) Superfamily [Micractinium conductrix]
MTACLPAMAVARVAAPWLRRLQPAEDDDGAAEPLLGLGKRSPSPSPLSRRSPAALPSTPSLAPLLGLGSRSPAATPGTATPGSLASATTSFTGGDAAAAAAALWGNAAAATDGGASVPLKRALALILIPTAFDLVASMLLAVGLLFVSASAFQMVRGSEVAFAALLSAACLGRRLNRLHIGGIAACMAGIGLVGAASMLDGPGADAPPGRVAAGDPSGGASSAKATLLGLALVIAAEAVQAAQVVAEDAFMHGSLGLSPMTVVGFEGVFGSLLMAALLPVVQRLPGREGGGLHEDSIDTLAQLQGSPEIRAAVWAYMGGVLLYNVSGMLVTDGLGATTRTVLESFKTLLLWVLNLLAWYAGGPERKLGEPWTAHSWLQALGFAVLVAGTLAYAQGEEAEARRLRARLRWARLRASLALLVPAPAAARPLVPPRIAAPSRIRTAFLEPAAVARAVEALQQKLEERRAAIAAAGGPAAAAASAVGGGHAASTALPAGRPATPPSEANSVEAGGFYFRRPIATP